MMFNPPVLSMSYVNAFHPSQPVGWYLDYSIEFELALMPNSAVPKMVLRYENPEEWNFDYFQLTMFVTDYSNPNLRG